MCVWLLILWAQQPTSLCVIMGCFRNRGTVVRCPNYARVACCIFARRLHRQSQFWRLVCQIHKFNNFYHDALRILQIAQMVLFFLWCLVPFELTVSTSPSTSCGCSGSERIEIHRDEYSSPDCSDGINSQSRVTIDAKGVRGTRSYNQLDVDWTNIKGDVLVSGKPERQTGTM